MKNILITGGSGFLGQHLIKELIKNKDYKIKVIDLKENENKIYNFPNVQYIFNKDVTDYNSIKDDFKNIDIVFHLAGLVSFWKDHKDKLFAINSIGTKNVLNACFKTKVKRVIHISSVATIGYTNSKGNLSDETLNFNWSKASKKYYMLSKHEAELEVKKAVDKGLNCIIANPGLMFGPGDTLNTLKMIKAIKEKKMPANTPGGTNIVDARDVAKGLISLIKKGKPGERYILGGYNHSFKKINKTIADVVGQNPPSLNVHKFFHKPLYFLVYFIESLSKKPIQLTSDNIDSSFMFRYFDSTKAKTELKWQPEIPFSKTIVDSYTWLREKNLI